jgi:hypothetical protein
VKEAQDQGSDDEQQKVVRQKEERLDEVYLEGENLQHYLKFHEDKKRCRSVKRSHRPAKIIA